MPPENAEFLRSMISVGGIPVIVGLTWIFKPFISDTRFYPFIAIGFGLLINLAIAYALGLLQGAGIIVAVLQGIIAGMAASGAYSVSSTFREGLLANKANRPEASPQ